MSWRKRGRCGNEEGCKYDCFYLSKSISGIGAGKEPTCAIEFHKIKQVLKQKQREKDGILDFRSILKDSQEIAITYEQHYSKQKKTPFLIFL